MLTLPDLTNKFVVITGASSGIGEALAYELGKHHCNLILLARSEDKLKEIKRNIEQENKNVKVYPLPTDLSKKEAVDKAVQEIKQITNELYALINNAGYASPTDTSLQETLENDNNNNNTKVIDAWEFMININLTNLMRITHSLLPLLLPKNKEILKTHPPAIINISSMLGRMVFNNAEGYCASKYGVVGFTKALFEDVREKGIKVTVIEPGFVNTKMPQTKHDNLEREKMMQVEDIVDTILYVLCTKSTICPTEIMVQSQVNPFKPL
ncbi:hypothetical protein ABK040_012508 [Willaertia magna]